MSDIPSGNETGTRGLQQDSVFFPSPATIPGVNSPSRHARPGLAVLLFCTLIGSYAFYWQSRDWNFASRLMLTYALVERHELTIDGYEQQAGSRQFNPALGQFEMVDGDLARLGPHYYTDKAPGQSFLGALIYAMLRAIRETPDHPQGVEAMAYWPSDYWITLGTSGVLTALIGVVLYAFSVRLGASHTAAVVLSLAYGLGTPAFVYGTLFYGHQASAFCTLTSFFLLYRAARKMQGIVWEMLLAGILAGYSLVVEFQTAVIGVILGLYAVMALRRLGPVLTFGVGAAMASGLLAAYNYKAFGDPLDLGYSHEVSRQFSAIHSSANPLGLRFPSWDAMRGILPEITYRPFRGLVFYSPVLVLSPVGLLGLLWKRQWGIALVSVSVLAWMVLVNVSYPLWEGGWCTGPRLLVPALPFCALLVAGWLTLGKSVFVRLPVYLAMLVGLGMMTACVSVGGRFPTSIGNPLIEIVWPHWRGTTHGGANEMTPQQALCDLCGQHPPSFVAGGRQFEWNIGRWLIEKYVPADWIPPEPSPWQALQMAPLGFFLLLMIGWLLARSRRESCDTAVR